MNIPEVRAQFVELGYDCIPLKPLSKVPLVKGWPVVTPMQQWNHAPNDSNIGLRAGGGKAFIDCDDKNQPGTFANITNWLDGLGYNQGSYPIIQTPSGIGRHVYVNFSGALLGNSRNLARDMGAGEFRFNHGAYVAAPPSVIEGGKRYEIIEGDLTRLPTLDIHDLAELINLNETPAKPTPTLRMSNLARALAKGQAVKQYDSRSQAEAALVLSLINSGYDFEMIKRVFDTQPCYGHYAEKRTNKSQQEAERWLRLTYKSALEYQSQNESRARRTIRELQERAELTAWPHATDKGVYLAHLTLASNAGKLEYHAASRDLALEAGVSRPTATNATKRLRKAGLVQLVTPGTVLLANRYSLVDNLLPYPKNQEREGMVKGCPVSQVMRDGKVLDLNKIENQDAFRNGRHRLGRRAGQIYKLLFIEPLTETEIASRIGTHVKTVRRALRKMSGFVDYKTGEILSMVSVDENQRWVSNIVDFDLIEAILGTRGATAKQKAEYQKERRMQARKLELAAIREKEMHDQDSHPQP